MQMHKKTKKILSFQKFIFLQISCISFLLYLLFEIWEEEENTDKTSKRLRGKGWDIGRPRGIWLDFLRHLRRNFLYITVDSNLIHFLSEVLDKINCPNKRGTSNMYYRDRANITLHFQDQAFSEPFFQSSWIYKTIHNVDKNCFPWIYRKFKKKDVKS